MSFRCANKSNPATAEFHATAVNDGQWTIGTISGSAPNIEARDLDGRVIGTFRTKGEAVAAVLAAKATHVSDSESGAAPG